MSKKLGLFKDYDGLSKSMLIIFCGYKHQNAPSKQHEAYYDIHYSTDRKVIEELYKWSWGYTHSGKPPATC